MAKLQLPQRPDGIQVKSLDSWTTNSIGTQFLKITLADDSECAVHEDSVDDFYADMDENNVFRGHWAVSKSGMVFKKVARTGSKPWEF